MKAQNNIVIPQKISDAHKILFVDALLRWCGASAKKSATAQVVETKPGIFDSKDFPDLAEKSEALLDAITHHRLEACWDLPPSQTPALVMKNVSAAKCVSSKKQKKSNSKPADLSTYKNRRGKSKYAHLLISIGDFKNWIVNYYPHDLPKTLFSDEELKWISSQENTTATGNTRMNNANLRIIAALKYLLLKGDGSQKFKSQSQLIEQLLSDFREYEGISKTTLENRFKDGNLLLGLKNDGTE